MTQPLSWKTPSEEKGIIIGADKTQEWLLPWWYFYYSQTNQYPVSFCNFGMSKKALSWCKERGNVIQAPSSDFMVKKENISKKLREKWEKRWATTSFWEGRASWFLKPLVLLQSPYKYSVWIDLDCQVLRPIDPIFLFARNPSGLSIAPDQVVCHLHKNPYYPKDVIPYNSGVISFQNGSPLVEKWASYCLEKNHLFQGDQDVIEHILSKEKPEFIELPILYNWSFLLSQQIQLLSSSSPTIHMDMDKCLELIKRDPCIEGSSISLQNLPISICHWHNQKGKENIRFNMELLEIIGAL
jgi:hypothetical protein